MDLVYDIVPGPVDEVSSFGGSSDRLSENSCASDADVTFRSSDGVIFNFYRKRLDVNSEGFAVEGIISHVSETVELSEPSSIVDLLLQFMSPQPQPVMDNMDFTTLLALAEAAEKYRVYPAMQICMVFMRNAMQNHPNALIVLDYAVKHGYRDLADAAAQQSIVQSVSSPLVVLPQRCDLAWQEYCRHWVRALEGAREFTLANFEIKCHQCNKSQLSTIRSLKTVSSLTNLGLLPLGMYSHTNKRLYRPEDQTNSTYCAGIDTVEWRGRVSADIFDIPKFSTFL